MGGWVLVRMKRPGARAQWLLIKHRDEYATSKVDVTEEVQTSVTTGRTMEEIAGGRSRVWNSNRGEKSSATATGNGGPRSISDVARAKRAAAKRPTTRSAKPTRKKRTTRARASS
jgi:bifunctional non-homologous end joining protein LigD